MAYPLRLYLQIVTEAGETIRFPAGGQAEIDLIDLCTEEILKLGVGLFRTQNHVERDIRQGIRAGVYRFKERTVKG